MIRRTILGLAAITVMGVGLLPGAALAQQSEADKVRATLDAAYAALSARDIAKMEAVWAHEADVMLSNPRDKTVSIGWDAAKKNWEKTFGFWTELKVTRADGPIRIHGDTAVATGGAEVAGKSKDGSALTFTTMGVDVLEKRGDKWLLVSHSAWRMPQ